MVKHWRLQGWQETCLEVGVAVGVVLDMYYCTNIHLGNGISDEYHVIRHVMNLEAVNTYEGIKV